MFLRIFLLFGIKVIVIGVYGKLIREIFYVDCSRCLDLFMDDIGLLVIRVVKKDV